jgi:hypothetical protein
LRRSPIPTNFEALKQVVLRGALVSQGMPKFELTESELEQIRAYIIQQSWATYDAQQRGTELGPQ